jgi:hypothetical protein
MLRGEWKEKQILHYVQDDNVKKGKGDKGEGDKSVGEATGQDDN